MLRVLVALISVLMLMSHLPVYAQDATALANQLGTQALGKYGSQGGLNQNINVPMISSGTQMQTLDGTNSFGAQILCPASKKYLELFVQPSATGDLASVIVSQDTNMDGTTDYNYAAPFAISGVCTNGVISCTPGTWTSCTYHMWSSDDGGRVSLQPTMANNLGGCYCINTNCGSNIVWNNLAVVLKGLGGGIASSIQKKGIQHVISDVQIDGTIITYYGQNAANCNTVSHPYGATNPQNYYSNWATMSSDVTNEVVRQAANPDSYYSMLTTASLSKNTQTVGCSIVRSAALTWSPTYECTVMEDVRNDCESFETNPECTLFSETVDDVQTYNNYNPTGLTPLPRAIHLEETKSASCEYSCPGVENINKPCFLVDGAPKCDIGGGTLANCEIIRPIKRIGGYTGAPNEVYIRGYYVTFQDGISAVGSSNTVGNCTCSCGMEVFSPSYCNDLIPGATACFNWATGGGRIAVKGAKVTSVTGAVGGCYTNSLSTYTDAELIMSTTCVSGGWVSTNNSYLYLSPARCPFPDGEGVTECVGTPAECHKSCVYDVSRDWWRKTRTYMCATPTQDLSAAKERMKTIKQSVTDNSGTLTYTDRRIEDGEVKIESGTIELTPRVPSEVCLMACKTRKPITAPEATVAGTSSGFQVNPSSYNFYYKQCVNSVCPLDVDEEMLKDCQCVNEFAEAALVMQSLRMGGQDLVCSSGAGRPLR